MNYEALFVNPDGRTARAEYVPALITIVAALAFFAYMVTGRTAHFCMLVLMYPAFVLLARRVQDMGYSGWLVLVPLAITLAAFGVVLGYISLSAEVDAVLAWIALAVSAVFALWACVGPGRSIRG
jgi:uncharacterized membrane protein YhaH (DUF805 family)